VKRKVGVKHRLRRVRKCPNNGSTVAAAGSVKFRSEAPCAGKQVGPRGVAYSKVTDTDTGSCCFINLSPTGLEKSELHDTVTPECVSLHARARTGPTNILCSSKPAPH
jgi:hypothetical protein